MHEFGIATEIVNIVKETVESRLVKRLVSVTVEVGQLAMVNPEQLKFSFEMITEGGPFEGVEMRVETLPAVAKCKCGFEGALGDEDYVCPKCGGMYELLSGRGICIKNLEVELEDES
ncbi:MAG: hydrogenase maturation nickel metallochaperone HypA/HybF [Halobacteriota archaeon]